MVFGPLIGYTFFIQGDQSAAIATRICSSIIYHSLDYQPGLPPSSRACTVSHNLCHQYSLYHQYNFYHHHQPWFPLSVKASAVSHSHSLWHHQTWAPQPTTVSTTSCSLHHPQPSIIKGGLCYQAQLSLSGMVSTISLGHLPFQQFSFLPYSLAIDLQFHSLSFPTISSPTLLPFLLWAFY